MNITLYHFSEMINGGDTMKSRINPQLGFNNVEILKETLQEELLDGSVVSLSALSREFKTFRIKLKPAINKYTINEICRKLNNSGYSTKLIYSRAHSTQRLQSSFRHRSMISRHTSANYPPIIIVAKVNSPNPPKEPISLPNPNGDKKPKKK